MAVTWSTVAASIAPILPVPTASQRAWQELELTMFVHFGVNTFSDREWGDGKEDPKSFNPAKLDPAPKCLDQPPAYFGPKVVMAGSVEEAVYVWASAWANRKPDQVAAFYSPQFQTAESGGAVAYIEDRKQQVANGDAPDARLEELKTKDAGPDRKVVTFVQRFGKDAYVKELTLARDAQGWRIVAERTLQKL